MAKTFLQVQKQIEQLQREAEQLRKKEADGVLSRIKEAIAVYGFTAADLGFRKGTGRAALVVKQSIKKTRRGKKQTGTATPKFRDDQGNVWSGRGPRPAWFKAALEAGKAADDLLAK
ncbi:H-NS histone family protein [Variovorax sp. EBFNA2]|uniref:H-NS histone family protein n=1 Tax=Variovorax sp. EBFNA2 TaxID=3342097 RepID=UPI0029C0CFDF|nr:H-NS histone family protein [Variovorax boronicumulans]WPG41612.1 H-NS histone family protein [Variovorax boronicumulans]